MTRLDLQQFAEKWLVDSKCLLDDQRWSAAYYLAGYAVECGLKACVLVRIASSPSIIFVEKRFSEKCWTHNLMEHVKLADLENIRVADASKNAALDKNWLTLKDWDEQARYSTTTQQMAEDLYNAITDNSNGVMPWIRVRW